MIKNGDFVKLHYTGKLQDGTVFDTTNPEVAQKEGLSGTKKMHAVTICVGQGMLIKGLDEALVGKSGKFSVNVPSEKAFGKKDPKLLRIIPTVQLHQQKINPHPGLQLNVDGNYGVVRSVASGRTVVDFNHPLASQDITYDVEILGNVTDSKEQIIALLEPIHIPFTEIVVDGTKATVKMPQLLPQPILEAIQQRIVKLTEVKTVSFEQGTAPNAHTGHDHAGHNHP